jgi:hypothetical protein
LLAAETTAPLVNIADAFFVSPGSTAMSQSKGASARPANIQMPLCHMASLPSLKSLESKSGVPAPCASVGIVVPAFETRNSAALRPASELKVADFWSGARNSPPAWASAL